MILENLVKYYVVRGKHAVSLTAAGTRQYFCGLIGQMSTYRFLSLSKDSKITYISVRMQHWNKAEHGLHGFIIHLFISVTSLKIFPSFRRSSFLSHQYEDA